MPMHDWTRVPECVALAFQHSWTSELSRALNGGLLPEPFYALPERHDIDTDDPTVRRQRVGVRHVTGDRLIALVEILSPANKKSSAAVHAFVEKANEFLSVLVNLLLVDPFPPTRRAAHGIHAAIFAESEDYQLQLAADRPLLCAAYEAGPTVRGYLEPLAVGEPVPDMPLFLAPGLFVEVPLEHT